MTGGALQGARAVRALQGPQALGALQGAHDRGALQNAQAVRAARGKHGLPAGAGRPEGAHGAGGPRCGVSAPPHCDQLTIPAIPCDSRQDRLYDRCRDRDLTIGRRDQLTIVVPLRARCPTNGALCNALTNGLLTRLDGPFAIAVDADVEQHQ